MNDTKLNSVLSEEQLLSTLKQTPNAYYQYLSMDDIWRKQFTDFCTGKRTLPLLYDVFFKKIFHPDVHPERLSRFISSVIGRNVRVIKILPAEDTFIAGERMVIMDIIVELEDGSITNVEIQKCPYLFPGQRISCYLSDLILRQYSRVKGERGKNFQYGNLKNVYTIVIYEKSDKLFHEFGETYLHHGRMTYDTGLRLDLLQHNYIIALDVFRKFAYYEDRSELSGWLSLLVTEDASEADALIPRYPWLRDIYEEIASYRSKPDEVITMYSEMLADLDRNTMRYMIDVQQEQIDAQQEQIAQKNQALDEAQSEIIRLRKILDEK